MGNNAAVGHSMNLLGCTDVVGFENSAKTVISLNSIDPWNAMNLVRDNLRRQAELARRSPLRKVPVDEGLQFIKQRVIHNNARPRLCCEPTRAASSDVQKDFDVCPGKNTMARQDAHEMPAADLEACMNRCKERGDGAFVVWRGKAYFKSQSSVACKQALFDDRDAVTYLNMVPKGEDFDIHEGMNTMVGKDANSLSASDLSACKRLCLQRGYGAFVVYRGVARFKSHSHLACREGLRADKEATTYLNLAPRASWRGWIKAHGELGKEEFVQMCCELLDAKRVQFTVKDRQDLGRVFDSIDFDGNGSLSLGEWAGGLSIFFKGRSESSVHAVFKALDENGDGKLSKAELQEYLKPLVKAMSPAAADSLRPILLKKATDDIFREMDLDQANDISSDEMVQWTRKDNNIVDRLAAIIDKEVYKIWLESAQGADMGAAPPLAPSLALQGAGSQDSKPGQSCTTPAVTAQGATCQPAAMQQGRLAGGPQGPPPPAWPQQECRGIQQGSIGRSCGPQQPSSWGQQRSCGMVSGGWNVPPPPPPPQRNMAPHAQNHYGPAPPGRSAPNAWSSSMQRSEH